MSPTTPITTAARVAVDADDFVYVSDVAIADRIVKFDTTGAQVDVWGSSGTGDGQFTSPGGIDFDAAGNLLIADGGVGRRVEIFQPDGTYVRKFGDSSVFTNVADVAVDAGGFVYTVDNSVNRVQKFGEEARPDALIAKPSDPPVGGDVYNADGTDQTVTQKVKVGKSASHDIDIENDAQAGSDAITVTGDAGNSKFKVKYDDGGTDVTAAVTGTGYVLADDPPGPVEDLTVKVKAKSSANPGNKRTVLVTATSGNDDTVVDAVKALTKAK